MNSTLSCKYVNVKFINKQLTKYASNCKTEIYIQIQVNKLVKVYQKNLFSDISTIYFLFNYSWVPFRLAYKYKKSYNRLNSNGSKEEEIETHVRKSLDRKKSLNYWENVPI